MGPTLDALEKKYGDDIRIAFRHYPLDFHEHAHMASQAGVYAQEHGKFWEYHDAIFKHVSNLDRDIVERVAGQVGLDVDGLKKALDNKTYAKRVDEDFAMGEAAGVKGTPAVFINGRLVEGARPVEDFYELTDKAMEQAKEMVRLGTAKKDIYSALMKMAQSGELPPNTP